MRSSKERKEMKDSTICLILYFLVLGMMTILGGVLSVSYILDESCTVANAAFLAGYDWSGWISHTGSYYYKYGQAILYYPILKIFSNPYLIYKLCMVINGIFYAFVPVLSYRILRFNLKQDDKLKCFLTAFAVSVVPGPVLYSLFARSDIMLIVLAWAVIYCLLQCLETNDKKKQILYISLTAFYSVYAYMCHLRGIIFVIAIFMLVFFFRFIGKEKNIIFSVFMVNMILWLYVDKLLARYFKSALWSSGIKKNTFSSVNTERFSGIFSYMGIKTLFRHMTGWFLSSFSGTFGMVTLGLFFTVVVTFYYLTKKKNVTGFEAVISLYGFLIYMGTQAMSSLNSYRSTFRFVTGERLKRADRFAYTRYLSVIYSVLVFIALYYLFFKKDIFGVKTKVCTFLFAGFLIVYCRTWLGPYTNGIEYSWRNSIDMALFFDTVRYGNDANKYHGVSRALLIMAVTAFAVLLVIVILGFFKKTNSRLLIICVSGLFMVSLAVNYMKLRLATDVRPMVSAASAINIMEEIEERTDISEEYCDVYADYTFPRYKVLQMALPHFDVHVRKSLNPEEIDNMFIVAKNRFLNENWVDDECYLIEDYCDTNEQTTVIVKGDDLKHELEKKGVKLVEIPADYTEKELEKHKLWFRKDLIQAWKYEWQSLTN